MVEILQHIVQSLLGDNADVHIDVEQDGRVDVYKVYIPAEHISSIIGRRGATAQGIRAIMRSIKPRQARIAIKFLET